MDKNIGIFIFIAIAIISKILEYSHKKKQDNTGKKTSTSQPAQKPIRPNAYIAPKNEIDNFLKQIGILQEPPEPVKKITVPPLKKQAETKQKKMETTKHKESIDIEGKQPDKLPELQTDSFVDIHKKDDSKTDFITISSMLKNKDSVKNAFILSEIFQPPLSLRGNDR